MSLHMSTRSANFVLVPVTIQQLSFHLGIHVDGGAVACHHSMHLLQVASITSKRQAPALPPGHTPLPWKQAGSVSTVLSEWERKMEEIHRDSDTGV